MHTGSNHQRLGFLSPSGLSQNGYGIYIYIYIHNYNYTHNVFACWCFVAWLLVALRACVFAWPFVYLSPPTGGRQCTANLPTNIVGFRGLGSSTILILRGGITMPIGNIPEDLSQAILVGMMLVGRQCIGLGTWRRDANAGSKYIQLHYTMLP